ncbi:hypothetical protein ACWEPM_23935 [Streptomyces sp. NPDC004244]
MRYPRAALATATALLALGAFGLGTTAYADGHHGNDSPGDTCTINNTGDHNHNACGNISYGDNATTGQGHNTRGSAQLQRLCITVVNNLNYSSPGITFTGGAVTTTGTLTVGPTATLAQGASTTACGTADSGISTLAVSVYYPTLANFPDSVDMFFTATKSANGACPAPLAGVPGGIFGWRATTTVQCDPNALDEAVTFTVERG